LLFPVEAAVCGGEAEAGVRRSTIAVLVQPTEFRIFRTAIQHLANTPTSTSSFSLILKQSFNSRVVIKTTIPCLIRYFPMMAGKPETNHKRRKAIDPLAYLSIV
jgi:hypothetical protein